MNTPSRHVRPVLLLLLAACSSASSRNLFGDDASANDSSGAVDHLDAGDAHRASSEREASPCDDTSVDLSVVDYFTGHPIAGVTSAIDGFSPGTSPFCLGPGVHPIRIQASGYAAYNGAIQLPGGATSRTVRLFPVTSSVAAWVALVNSDRQSNGAPAVQLDTGLMIAAWDHAVDMGVQGYFAHFDPHGFSPTTRSLLLGSMMAGWENIAAGAPSYEAAEAAFMSEKTNLPNQSPSDCAKNYGLAGHYCDIVATSHTSLGLAIASVPGSPWTTYYDQELGDLYGYFDTTVIRPEPLVTASASLTLVPATGETFVYEYAQTMPAPLPIAIATLNADPECSSMCPPGDAWYPMGNTPISYTGVKPYTPMLTASDITFVGLTTNVKTFFGDSALAGFWGGGTVMPDSYGAASKAYLVP